MRAEFARVLWLCAFVAIAATTRAQTQLVAPPGSPKKASSALEANDTNVPLIDDRPKKLDAPKVGTQRANAATERPRELPSLDLQMRLKDVKVTTTPQGDVVTVDTDNGPMNLDAAEYLRALVNTKVAVEEGGLFYKLFNISKPWGFVWISVGFLGQAMFTFRMVLQWWASEKHKRSIVPVGFWWGSLIGGAMLFVYFVWRKDIVGIIGQSTGVFVYARNLVLIYGGKRIEAESARTLGDGEEAAVLSSARKT